MKEFVHLHVHSEYSLLDGYAHIPLLAARAAELGMDALALTDHGVMYGVMDFYAAAKKAGIKPIIGMEAYMAVGSHSDTSPKGKGYYHTLLLARDEIGYRNLVRLTTRAHLDGFYYKPRIDHALLAEHSAGLVVTSSCLSGEINKLLTQGQKEEARRQAAWHRDLLGEHFYLELQLHPGAPELEGLNDELVRIGTELGIPLVCTNDAHYVRREDAEAHRMVMAMGFNTTLRELCAKEPDLDDSYHLKTGEEMWALFKRYGTAPLENTRRIADQCNLKLDFGRVELPEFALPEGHTAASYLQFVCEEGLMRRFHGAPPDEHVKRLHYELEVINQTGFPDYMLIVWDYVKFARARGIPCLPRGSAGASLVLYCLGITDVDPVQNKLLFERFLSPERLEMPDIDIDFADSRRHEVLEYVTEKYGRENTAQIITFGTLGAKAALRDMGRVLDIPLNEVDRVAKLIPALPVGITISQALERVPELKQIYDSDASMRELIDRARLIEGRMRSVGTHACGVVVSRHPLVNTVPLQRTTRDEHAVMAAFEGPTLAKIGLLKMDILGLTNLSVVANALDYIAQSTGKRMELADIPLTDRRTFESLSRGETTNVFQFESAGMTKYLRELKPTRVEDLYAMVALYRPGPLEQIPIYVRNKNHPHQITYLHPILKPILEDTYGVIVYQEQIMQLLQSIAGYTLGNAYIVLKAIGKKNRQLMAEEEPRFKEGCLKNGLTREQADQLWDLIQPFAGYSFNRPHSTLYGLLSYQTAYLKVNYPTEYMAAVLSAAAGVIDDVAKGVAECQRLGVAVLPVDVNCSGLGFTIESLPENQLPEYTNRRGIRFGLSAIKNVGQGPVEAILAARAHGGSFTSLEDFCTRVDRHALNKRVVEALVKCGALDQLPGSRRQKLTILDQAIGAGIEAQKAREAGQASMFDLFGGAPSGAVVVTTAIPMPVIPTNPADAREELAWEKELLGMYISSHPVAAALASADTSGAFPLAALNEDHAGQRLTFVGMLSNCRRVVTKKGDSMLVGMLEDIETSIELVAFPKIFERYAALLVNEALVRVTAKVDRRNDTLQLVVEQVAPVTPRDPAQPPALRASVAALPAEMDLEHDEAGGIAPDDRVPPPIDAPPPGDALVAAVPAAPSAGARAQSNGTGTMSHSEHVPAGGPPSVSVIKPRTRVSLPSNGNGGAAAPGTPAVRTLRLRLPRTTDQEHDIRLMQDLYQLLQGAGGPDQIMLLLPGATGTVVMRPHLTVQATGGLVETLSQLLGPESVELVY